MLSFKTMSRLFLNILMVSLNSYMLISVISLWCTLRVYIKKCTLISLRDNLGCLFLILSPLHLILIWLPLPFFRVKLASITSFQALILNVFFFSYHSNVYFSDSKMFLQFSNPSCHSMSPYLCILYIDIERLLP